MEERNAHKANFKVHILDEFSSNELPVHFSVKLSVLHCTIRLSIHCVRYRYGFLFSHTSRIFHDIPVSDGSITRSESYCNSGTLTGTVVIGGTVYYLKTVS
jgi:hypothetical protein